MGARDLDAWQQELNLAEAELRARERQAMQGEPTPQEPRAFAEEHDKIASERDGLADAHDEQARERDAAAFARDIRGSSRDRAARYRDNDRDVAAIDRFAAGADRDFAAGDRADSIDDRQRAYNDRQAATDDRQRAAGHRDAAANRAGEMEQEIAGLREALLTRLEIGRAEGLLMARYNLDPDAAFSLLVRLSQAEHVKLRDIAARLVADAVHQVHAGPDEPPASTDQ